jgi:hypothetical protein
MMTESDWLESSDPEEMLVELGELEASDRKVRLFMCACCRRIWDLFKDERCRRAVEIAERYADGLASDDEITESQEAVDAVAEEADEAVLPHFEKLALVGSAEAAAFALSEGEGKPMTWEAKTVAEWTVYALAGNSSVDDREREAKRLTDFEDELKGQCGLLRDIFGNPFRPVAVKAAWSILPVVKLARAIYDEQNFDRLPALADALEQAGCHNDAILSHFRQPDVHVKGCWALDLLLGKE